MKWFCVVTPANREHEFTVFGIFGESIANVAYDFAAEMRHKTGTLFTVIERSKRPQIGDVVRC